MINKLRMEIRFFPLRSLLVFLSPSCYIPICLGYGRRDICSFSFQMHVTKISLIDICVFEREGGYDSLSNARDVIQQFNPKHHMISSANSHNFWSYYRGFFLPPSPQHQKSCENPRCSKAQEWKAWKCAAVVIKNINNTKKINSKNTAFIEH